MVGSLSSMTGYGLGEEERSGLRVVAELRSVNHRFLDLQLKVPRGWAHLEAGVAARVRDRLTRGRVEVLIKREKLAQSSGAEFCIDEDLAARYFEAAERIAQRVSVTEPLRVAELLRMPGVVELREVSEVVEDEADLVLVAVDRALDSLIVMREQEGSNLVVDLRSRLDRVDALRTDLEALARRQVEAAYVRLRARLNDLLEDGQLDHDRLAQEAALLADKAAIDEELTRLRSHVELSRVALDGSEPVGKRLNFLVQEMGREANTCGNKAALSEMSAVVVELKSELEKIREQAANLE